MLAAGCLRLWSLSTLGALAALEGLFLLPLAIDYRREFVEPALSEGASALALTLAFSFASAALAVVLGFAIALACQPTTRLQAYRLTPGLLLPALIGSGVTAVVFRPTVLSIDAIHTRPLLVTWGALLAMQLWQFTPMSAFLFNSRLSAVNSADTEFALAHRLPFRLKAAHLWWPASRDLAVFVFILVFCLSVAEADKASIILHPSQATSTQFVAHWHQEALRVWQTADVESAYQFVHTASLAFAPLVILSASLGCLLFVGGLGCLVRAVSRARFATKGRFDGRQVVPAGTTLLALAPIGIFALASLGQLSVPAVCDAAVALAFAAIGAVPMAVAAVAFGVSIRMAFPGQSDRFSPGILTILLSLLLVRAVPSLSVALCAFEWSPVLSDGSVAALRLGWALGLAVVYGPFLIAFVIYLHFDVHPAQISTCDVGKVTPSFALKHLFWKRLRSDYGFVYLFAVCFCLIDTSVSEPMSHAVHSIGIKLAATAGPGRSSDPAAAGTLSLLIILIATAAILGASAVRYRQESSRG